MIEIASIRWKFVAIYSTLSLIVAVVTIPFSLLAQGETTTCEPATLEACYQQALQFYRSQDFGAAQSLFEQIIAMDVRYKNSVQYLKKCHRKLAKQKIAEQTQRQRLAKEEPKQKKEALAEQQAEQQFLTEKKVEMEETGRIPPETEIPKEAVYHIDVGDVLGISVWRNPDLEKNVVVRPDGVISFPLVGDMPAVGLALTELDEQLTSALTAFIRNPVVSVAVVQFGGVKVIALGEVQGQGIFSVPGGGSVIDVIALAGGFTKDAVRRSTFLIRGGLDNPQVYRLNLARVFKGDLTQNIPIQSNDIIYVPKTFIAHFNEAISRVTPLLSNMLLGTSVLKDLKLIDR